MALSGFEQRDSRFSTGRVGRFVPKHSRTSLKMLDIESYIEFTLAVYAGILVGFNALCWAYGVI